MKQLSDSSVEETRWRNAPIKELAKVARRRSVVVDLLARVGKPLPTGAIAQQLGVDLGVMCTRVRQLEESGRIKAVGTATRTRDVRWTLVDPADMRGPRRAICYGGQRNLEAMERACRQRLMAGSAVSICIDEP